MSYSEWWEREDGWGYWEVCPSAERKAYLRAAGYSRQHPPTIHEDTDEGDCVACGGPCELT